MLCGRTYDLQGKADETWRLTAKRVKIELERAGFRSVDDKQIELLVAFGRARFLYLFEKRREIPMKEWEYLTFGGSLALAITMAEEGYTVSFNKITVRLGRPRV